MLEKKRRGVSGGTGQYHIINSAGFLIVDGLAITSWLCRQQADHHVTHTPIEDLQQAGEGAEAM